MSHPTTHATRHLVISSQTHRPPWGDNGKGPSTSFPHSSFPPHPHPIAMRKFGCREGGVLTRFHAAPETHLLVRFGRRRSRHDEQLEPEGPSMDGSHLIYLKRLTSTPTCLSQRAGHPPIGAPLATVHRIRKAQSRSTSPASRGAETMCDWRWRGG